MDRKQRDALAHLLDKQAWYIATTSDNYTNEEWDQAKREFLSAKHDFVECEPETPIKVEVVNLSKGSLL